MKQGDFSALAKHYHNRPAYPLSLMKYILQIAGYGTKTDFAIADIGAGTGKMTAVLGSGAPKAKIIAVEPNDEMRAEGKKAVTCAEFIKGSAEATTLASSSMDFACMASSFHWSDHTKSLPEFRRILKPNGIFCAIWNSRQINSDEILQSIENEIKAMIPTLNRVSSGLQNTKDWQSVITSTGDFKDCVYMQMPYTETMSKERYLGAWRSVNDIQAQAISYGGGEQLWNDILKMIEEKIKNKDSITQHYTIKAFVATSTK